METPDYRQSHLRRGPAYDETLSSVPFDAYMDRWEEHHVGAIVQRLFPAGVPRYLDFACGTGRITQRLESRTRAAFGVDVSESMLSVARRKCRQTRFVCADLTRDDVDLGLFDLVTAFRFFGNAQDELRHAALAALSRHTRPGGYLLVNNHRNPRALLHVWRERGATVAGMDLTHAKLARLLEAHGFAVVDRRAIAAWMFRFRLASGSVLASPWAARAERVLAHSLLAPIAPDAVVLARRAG